MSNGPTLLILAAGMATRYGSLKQLDAFGPNGETIIEYAVFDAKRVGFKKVIFVIRKAIKTEFKEAMLPKFADKIAVDFVLQELDILPTGFTKPEERQKPWGTAHAVWMAASKIQEPFAVINGDDFYGYESYKLMADFLNREAQANHYGLVGYKLKNTLSEHGAVARGLCRLNAQDYLEQVTELTQIQETNKGITAPDVAGNEIILAAEDTVSMNLMGFTPAIFPFLEKYLKTFLDQNINNLKAECYLPMVVNHMLQAREAQVKVLHTPEKWFGVTYPGDKPDVVAQLQQLIKSGAYPNNLWTAE